MTADPRRRSAPPESAEADAVVLPFPPPAPGQVDPDREVFAPLHFRRLVHAQRERARRERAQAEGANA